MRERVCRNCGGRQYKVVGQNMVKCQFCGTLYVDEQASKEEEFLTISAYETLRSCRFDEALLEFDKVLSLYPMSFEGHFGKMQAKNKIVIYNNKRWERKVPRFFGDKIVPITEDEDFVEAVKNAPQEVIPNYNEIAKRIEKIAKNYEQIDKTKPYDVIVCAMDFHKENPDEKVQTFLNELKAEGLSAYFLQGLETKEKEEETFFALKTAKAFVLFANSSKGYADPTYKNLFDRYLYFVTQKKKFAKSFIVALDEGKVKGEDIPADLLVVKNIITTSTEGFNDVLLAEVKKQAKNTARESAKIETIKVERVSPQKKEYLDVENVNPIDLGYYEVENIESGEVNKVRWIFLSLKNGDFVSARQNIDVELEKDPNNAELIFADLLCEKQLRSAGEFFASISNFTNKEKIDKILTYASKDFAEMFVDNWEKLVVEIDSEEYYNAFVLYLAQFNTPYRDEFISAAENKAVLTQDPTLIENVTKCFGKEDVDRFINFYFMLAQQSDNTEYYDKILEIDPGHKSSNIALFVKHLKESGDVLSYQNKEELENTFKYFDDDARMQYVSAVANIVLPVAFKDLQKAEAQLDFYLSYVAEAPNVAGLFKTIASQFAQFGFFKQAEKYISLAISKDKENAQLYWELLKIKAHCQSDMDVITSSVDFTQAPEWSTILKLADDQQTEKYAEITSRAHLTSTEKKPLSEDMLDLVTLKEKLRDFLNRNSAILLERTKEDDVASIKGVNYYKLQLVPIVNYFENLDGCESFEDYENIYERLFERLKLLDLTLDASISAINIAERGEGLKNINTTREDVKIVSQKLRHYKEKREHRKFWKNFAYIVFEWIPILFTLMFLTIILIDPKLVYMYFPQEFVLGFVLYGVAIAVVNLIVYSLKKKLLSTKQKVQMTMLIVIALLSLLFMCYDFFFTTNTIEVTTTQEFATLIENASYGNIVLTEDLDFDGIKLSPKTFAGKLDGNGHTISNVVLTGNGDFALFKFSKGEIKNLTIELKENTYSKVKSFAGLVKINTGKITNCLIVENGTITLNLLEGASVGGLVAENNGGTLIKNSVDTNFVITGVKKANISGLAGVVKEMSTIKQNNVKCHIEIQGGASSTNVGGLAGYVTTTNEKEIDISENKVDMYLSESGTSQGSNYGGLIGKGFCGSENNYTLGQIVLDSVSGDNYAGGLYGSYQGSTTDGAINHSYTKMAIAQKPSLTLGCLVGYAFGGKIENSYTSQNYAGLCGTGVVIIDNCMSGVSGYSTACGFSPKIWTINGTSQLPTLKWEN